MKILFGAIVGAMLSVPAFADGICNGALCVGSTVINANDSIGTVTAFSGNDVTYVVSGYTLTADAASLSPEVPSVGGLARGDEVINRNDSIGSVQMTFADSRVQYVVSGYTLIERSTNLTPTVPSYAGLTRNESVINPNDSLGTVTDIFADGRIQYVVSGYTMITQASNLTAETTANGAIQDGTTVINSNDSIGTVLHIFADGRMQYSVSGYTMITKQLWPLVSSVAGHADIAAGSTVMNVNDSVGAVTAVFANGRAQYNVSGYTMVTDVTTLTPEVSSNPTYVKGVQYADGNYNVCTPTAFFKDGRMQVAYVGGNSGEAATLVSAAPITGFEPGTAVVIASGTQGIVDQTFANGTVLYTYVDPTYKEKRTVSGKAFGFVPAQLTNDEQTWISSLSYSLSSQNQEPWSVAAIGAGLVSRVSDYAGLKAKLLALLKLQPQLVSDSAVRAQVIAVLSK